VRIETIRRFAKLRARQAGRFADLIARETGKPLWEARTEASGDQQGRHFGVGLCRANLAAALRGRARLQGRGPAQAAWRARGATGPITSLAHLPNGHIVPALIAGNAVVFKPSEQTTGGGRDAGVALSRGGHSRGCDACVQGGPETGKSLASQPEIDGLLFTGSARAGLSLHRQFSDTPNKILALEMGGNNPLVVWDARTFRSGGDLRQVGLSVLPASAARPRGG
jgi:succinylglutamic semialdehyde dehydrogenase